MPISQRDLIDRYGGSVRRGAAALFVGAGLSRGCGFPDWEELMAKPRADASIPDSISDLPLVAEYYERNMPGGRENLHMYVLGELAKVKGTPGLGHELLARLPIDELWTTNYDCLIETVEQPSLGVVYDDDDLRDRRVGRRRLVKMHGSMNADGTAWTCAPVLTRGDYEAYEGRCPRTWAALKATYLTKSFLFLGFSFADPNIELLLRLARSIGDSAAPEHFTVLTRPDADRKREHELRVDDLERSGIAVCEIDSHDELVPLLQKLMRRTRGPFLFVSGSDGDGINLDVARAIGNRLAELPDLKLCSLAGPAALNTSFGFGDARAERGMYEARDIEFHFRKRQDAAPRLDQRTGMAIYTGMDQDPLRKAVLDEARAALILGGGDRTSAEIDLALSLGVPVVPIPMTGGAAKAAYDRLSPSEALGRDDLGAQDETNWQLLESATEGSVIAAVYRLVRTAMGMEHVDER